MAVRIVVAVLSIFVLAGIALRNTPECREKIGPQAAIDIALKQIPQFTSGASKIVFESEAFTSKYIKKEKTENGWSISPRNDDNFNGYYVLFNFKNESYGGIAHFAITNCGKVRQADTGAWLMKPLNSQALR